MKSGWFPHLHGQIFVPAEIVCECGASAPCKMSWEGFLVEGPVGWVVPPNSGGWDFKERKPVCSECARKSEEDVQ